MYVWLIELDSPHIDPRLTICSQSPELHQVLLLVLPSSTSLQEKIDYTWTSSPKHNEVAPVCHSLRLGELGITLSQMTNTYRRKWKMAMFCGAEVKRADGDELESRAELASWMAVGLRKSHSLRLCADGHYEDSRQTDTTPIGDGSPGQT